jgi:hypothetical protein
MTQGTVDLKVVGDLLKILETCLGNLRALPQGSLQEFLSDQRNAPAAESLLRRAIQAFFDLLRHVVARAHPLVLLTRRSPRPTSRSPRLTSR